MRNTHEGDEKVRFSDTVVKTNKRGKEQSRILLITSHAIYNIKSTMVGYYIQRRIPISDVQVCARNGGNSL